MRSVLACMPELPQCCLCRMCASACFVNMLVSAFSTCVSVYTRQSICLRACLLLCSTKGPGKSLCPKSTHSEQLFIKHSWAYSRPLIIKHSWAYSRPLIMKHSWAHSRKMIMKHSWAYSRQLIIKHSCHTAVHKSPTACSCTKSTHSTHLPVNHS